MTGLAIIPGSATVASVSRDGILRLWNQDGSLLSAWSLGARPDAIAVSRNGKVLAIAADDGTIGIRALPGLALTRDVHVPSAATLVALSPDGSAVAALTGATVTVWNTADGTLRRSVGIGTGWFDAIAFSPDGQDLAAVTSRGSVIVGTPARAGRSPALTDDGPGQRPRVQPG